MVERLAHGPISESGPQRHGARAWSWLTVTRYYDVAPLPQIRNLSIPVQHPRDQSINSQPSAINLPAAPAHTTKRVASAGGEASIGIEVGAKR